MRQALEVSYCALYGSGGWVDTDLYPKGLARFTYVSEPEVDYSEVKHRHLREVYVAFWNSTRNAGELLVFDFFKNSHGRDFFILNNQGHIVLKNGHLDVLDALWGIYTHNKLVSKLPKLKRKPVIIVNAARLTAGSSICKTPLDKDDENWPW